jgi:hypothetical protein
MTLFFSSLESMKDFSCEMGSRVLIEPLRFVKDEIHYFRDLPSPPEKERFFASNIPTREFLNHLERLRSDSLL